MPGSISANAAPTDSCSPVPGWDETEGFIHALAQGTDPKLPLRKAFSEELFAVNRNSAKAIASYLFNDCFGQS